MKEPRLSFVIDVRAKVVTFRVEEIVVCVIGRWSYQLVPFNVYFPVESAKPVNIGYLGC